VDVAAFLAEHAAEEVCRLVTTGRRTGRSHDIEMWFGVDGGRVLLISGNGESAHWYLNLLADPEVELRIGGEGFRGTARAASSDERYIIGDVMGRKYGGWGGDPDIGLTEPAWVWEMPGVVIDQLEPG
jgi:deazaflavin-dependent oxidoreductase (nitroreductase family)